MAVNTCVVPEKPQHKPSTKERVAVKRKHPEVIMKCVGVRKEPSKEALDRFIDVYIQMVNENQKKLKEGLKK